LHLHAACVETDQDAGVDRCEHSMTLSRRTSQRSPGC
jgi:hypothetical protein